ncbi:tyrosine-type recombinase/integrase, partial [Desulfobacterota bacterium AH_259_B03_O07]|nr:tyrosine-type recombinase/integrase [Desulfobacterota bacterium AH_259_B03_O07]
DEACPNLKLVITTAFYSGLRLGELLKLTWKDIDFDKGYIFVRDSKNYESRAVPLNPELKRQLTSYKEEDDSKH